MFYFDKLNGKNILKSTLIEEANAFFTTREVSMTDLESFHCQKLIAPQQTHSDNVKIVNNSDEYNNTDSLILTEKDILICLKFADCTPLIFYDRENNAGAVAHAGWRGTAKKIGVKTALTMHDVLGTKLDNLQVLIGPAISKCCYEVSADVKETLLSTVKNRTNLFYENNVDLKQINARQLEEIGIKNIDICPYCTSCNNELFYSYRKENGTINRHYAVLYLN